MNVEAPSSDIAYKRKVKAASIAGSAVGIAAAAAGAYLIAKKGNPSLKFKNITYDEKDILMIGAGSIAGGLSGGLIADKKEGNREPKLREAIQQFFGSLVCPIGVLAGANKLVDFLKIKIPEAKTNCSFLNNTLKAAPKVALTIGSLILGMQIGNKLVNKINNQIFKKEETREVHASDYLVHADDLCVAANLILKDTKAISAVTSKILPATFILAGAKTGIQEAQP